MIWRNPYFISLLRLADLPLGYYADGDWQTQCEVMKAAASDNAFEYCEDAIFWDHFDSGKLSDRLVIISCDPGRKSWNTVMGPLRDPKPQGGLWLYAPGDSKPPRRIFFEGYPEGHDFHPLGLEIYPSHNGNSSNLFVINHARERSYIEQFTLNPAEPTVATWVRTLTSSYFVAPNGIALTSPTSFYVTNDHFMTRRLPKPFGNMLPMIETVLALPFSWIAHVALQDTHAESTALIEHSFAAFGLAFANGVALSPDGLTLAISSTSTLQVHLYNRSPQTNALTFVTTVPVPFAPDNLSYDDEGTLFAAGHPHFPSVISIAKGKLNAVAPSWVVSILPRADSQAALNLKEYDSRAPVPASMQVPGVLTHEVKTMFQSNGTLHGTSATGLRDSRTGFLFVVGLYEQGMLVCKP